MEKSWMKWGVILNFIMLIAILIGLLNINIPLPSFAKVEHTAVIYTLEEPISSEMLPALKISPVYYIELIVKPPQNVNYGDTLRFSTNTIDKGKKTVEKPEFRVFIVDSIGNIRGVYPPQVINLMQNNSTNLLLINDDFEKEESRSTINFNFTMPPEDQKVIGDWKIFVYLFDKGNGMLVSYNVCEFMVGRSERESSQVLFSIMAMVIGLTVVIFVTLAQYISRRRK
jgi:hypothetical protein